LSTLGQPHPEPAWKQEVARRLAAHKNRKGGPVSEELPQAQHFGGSIAAKAAARVAARFATAPSYSEMQAEEARMAVRAAEIATKVALEAQAVAESALAELHAASEDPPRGPAVVESITRARLEPEPEVGDATAEPESVLMVEEPVVAGAPATATPVEAEPAPVYTRQIVDGQSFGIRWEPDTPVRVLQPRPAPPAGPFELDTEDWWTPAQVSATLRSEPIAVETEPGHANLIEFPRELVATRRMRPRLVEPAPAPSTERQLSIFEVDPCAVSIEPAPAQEVVPALAWSDSAWPAPSSDSRSAREWSGPEWSGIELDEHPVTLPAVEPESSRSELRIFLAPLGYRLMAMTVDACLILAAFFAGAVMFAGRMHQAPAIHTVEAVLVLGLVLTGFAYNALFFALRISTPGMRYAGLALSTFDDESPTRAQLRRRLGAMALSLLPMGLGLAWCIFDEDHLTWHDRISQTYLRKR
jgi:uncharacterized RDD family membrane protein YckC